MEIMFDKKHIWATFLFKFRMGHKPAETTHDINSSVGLGMLVNVQCSRGSSFAKETSALKTGAQWLAVRSWQQPAENHHWSWSSYNYTRSFQRTQCWPFFACSALEANWKGEKPGKRVPYELTENQNHRSQVSFSYSMQQQQTISWSDCDVWQKINFIRKPATTSSVAGPRSSKAIPKAKLAPEKVMVTGHLLPVLIHYSFPNPG